MAIDKMQKTGELVVSCDSCSESEAVETGQFQHAVEWMKDHDWRIRKVGQSWEHTCPVCLEEEDE